MYGIVAISEFLFAYNISFENHIHYIFGNMHIPTGKTEM